MARERSSIRVAEPVERKFRRYAPRSKTGCQTCRKRRVKCDETGPPCKKCVVLQLECIYQDPSPVPNTHQTALVSLSRSGPDWRHGPTSIEATRQELRIFDLLRKSLVNRIGGPIDGPFWTYDILQAAQTYPSIWHSCLGITAIFDQANNQANKSSFVLDQYSKSLSYMQKQMAVHKGTPTYSEQGSLLMSSLLLAGLCRLMLIWPEALTHSRHAAQVYHQWGYRLQGIQERDSSRGPIRGKYINAMMATVEIQLFSLMSDECKAGWTAHLDIAPCSDAPHRNSTDIFYELQPLYTGFHRNILSPLFGTHSGSSSMLSQSTHILCRELSRWQEKFAKFQESRYYSPNSPEAIILDMHAIATDILSRLCLAEADVADRSQLFLYHRFIQVMERALANGLMYSKIMGQSSPSLNYSSDLAHVTSMAIASCPSRALQKHIMHLIVQAEKEEQGRRRSTITGAIHMAIIQLEDEALAAAAQNPSTCACLPPDRVCTMHRYVLCAMIEAKDDLLRVRFFTRHDLQHQGTGKVVSVPI